MPNINLAVDKSLLAEVNYAAAKEDLTQRDWVVKVLGQAALASRVLGEMARYPTLAECENALAANRRVAIAESGKAPAARELTGEQKPTAKIIITHSEALTKILPSAGYGRCNLADTAENHLPLLDNNIAKMEPSRPGYCDLHERKMMDFGTKWICEGPPAHTVVKGA